MAEMFAVPAVAAALLHPVTFGQRQCRFVDDAGYRLEPWRAQLCGVDRDTFIDQAALAVVAAKHLAGIGPEIVDRGLRAAMAFLGAVAEPNYPFRRMPQMIRTLLFRFGRALRIRRP